MFWSTVRQLVEREPLRHVADPPLHALGIARRRRCRRSSARPDVGVSSPHSMRMVVDLPGAVAAEEPEHLAAPNVERDVVDRAELSRTSRDEPVDARSRRRSAGHRSPDRAHQPRLAEAERGQEPRALELGLEPARLPRRALGARRDARREPLARRTRRASVAAATASPDAASAARADRHRAGAAGPRRRPSASKSSRRCWRASACGRGARPARRARGRRPRAPGHVHAEVPAGIPLVGPRHEARVRARRLDGRDQRRPAAARAACAASAVARSDACALGHRLALGPRGSGARSSRSPTGSAASSAAPAIGRSTGVVERDRPPGLGADQARQLGFGQRPRRCWA